MAPNLGLLRPNIMSYFGVLLRIVLGYLGFQVRYEGGAFHAAWEYGFDPEPENWAVTDGRFWGLFHWSSAGTGPFMRCFKFPCIRGSLKRPDGAWLSLLLARN